MTQKLTKRMRKLADLDSRAGEPLGKCLREAADHIDGLDAKIRDGRTARDFILANRREWKERALAAEAKLPAPSLPTPITTEMQHGR